MSKKKKFKKNNRKRNFLIQMFVLLFLFVGIGYATLNTHLEILGNLFVSKVEFDPQGSIPRLMNYLSKREATVKKYSGPHIDSPMGGGTEDIIYWKPETPEERETVANMNNIIYAGHCWQILRTTDTGGTKIIYNGMVSGNNTCDSSRTNIGYTHILRGLDMSDEYYYGDRYTYNPETKTFQLSGEIFSLTYDLSKFSEVEGKFTCHSLEPDGECSVLYYVYQSRPDSDVYLYATTVESNSDLRTIGTGSFYSGNYRTLAAAGYMFNDVYLVSEFKLRKSFAVTSYNMYRSGSFSVSDSVSWSSASGCWILDNPTTVSLSELPNYVGYYGKSSSYATCASYIVSSAPNGTNTSQQRVHSISLAKDENCMDDSSCLGKYMIADSYTYDSVNKRFILSDPITINKLDLVNNGSDYIGKYYCMDSECKKLYYFNSQNAVDGLPFSRDYYYDYNEVQKYGNSFEWDGEKYTLMDTVVIEDQYSDYQTKGNYHYTCHNYEGTCETIYFVYYDNMNGLDTNASNDNYELALNNGESIEQVIQKMLHDDNVNTYDSSAKKFIELWYEQNLTDYTNDLEDVVFCNDRTIASPGGWGPDSGTIEGYLTFTSNVTDFSCPNVTDQFSVSNPKAKLKYPIGLITGVEFMNSFLPQEYSDTEFWTMTPKYFYPNNNGGPNLITSSYGNNVSLSKGIRPVISLKKSVKFSTGNGSLEDPYYFGNVYSITNTNALFPSVKESPPRRLINLSNEGYVVLSFKLNGTLIEGESFKMPEEDVTITDINYIVSNYSITSDDDTITFPEQARYNTSVTIVPIGDYRITSFRVNGNLVEGDTFTMPGEDVVISDVQKIIQVIVESEHNPYPQRMSNQVYYENTFEGATSISVDLTYQVYVQTNEWIYIYTGPNTIYNNQKFSGGFGSSMYNASISYEGNYIKITFTSDHNNHNYYGFKAVIVPHYD